MLIGFGHMVWIVYKAYAHGVSTGAEEQASRAAMDGDDVEQQRVDKCAEVASDGSASPFNDQSKR